MEQVKGNGVNYKLYCILAVVMVLFGLAFNGTVRAVDKYNSMVELRNELFRKTHCIGKYETVKCHSDRASELREEQGLQVD